MSKIQENIEKVEKRKYLKLKHLIMIPCLILIYAFIHEASHALVAMLFGGKITEFHVFGLDAHVSYEGGNISNTARSLISVAGSLIPTLLLIAFSLFYKYKENRVFLRELFGLFSVSVICSNLVWVFSPFLYMFGIAGNGDTDNFLDASGWNPSLISLFALLVIAIQILTIWKKDILKPILPRYSAKKVVIFVCVIMVILISVLITNSLLRDVTIFNYTADENITTQDKSTIPIYIEKNGSYKLFFTLDNPGSGMMIDVQVLDPQGNEIFQCIGDEFKLSEPLSLERGINTVEILYLHSKAEFIDYVTNKYTFDNSTVNEMSLIFDNISGDAHEIKYSVIIKSE